MRTVYFRLLLLLLLPCALWLPRGVGQELPDLGDVSQATFSLLEERRLGENIMHEIRRDLTYNDDPELADYINTLGYRLVAASSDARQDFEFFIMRDATLNAFAMPGGFIGVHTGLILAAQSESELAGVLAHEVSHVTQRHIARQISRQGQVSALSLAGLALALLASRASSDLAQAAAFGSQAGVIATQLNYTREFEREADRIGFQTLQRANFNVQGMAAFFERLQKRSRLVENNAPAYLRTHPLTGERISDMQNRSKDEAYRQVPDSIEFQLVRAKLKAAQGTPQESFVFFDESLKERKYLSEAASRYGLVAALIRLKRYARATQELRLLRDIVRASPIVDALGARIQHEAGDYGAAQQAYRDALKNYPGNRTLVYGYADALLRGGKPDVALELIENRLQSEATDSRLYQLRAQCYAALSKPFLQHRALAEYQYRLGNLRAAIEQLLLAQATRDGDFFQQSSVDARLRQLRAMEKETRRENSR